MSDPTISDSPGRRSHPASPAPPPGGSRPTAKAPQGPAPRSTSDASPRRPVAPTTGGIYGATIADARPAAGGPSPASSRGGAPATDDLTVIHEIGRGGMGVVYLAFQERLHRWVAVKRLAPQYAGDEHLIKRFQAEAEAEAALSHIHIVQVFRTAEDDEGPFLVMEYLAGPVAGTRADWSDDWPNPPMTLEDLVRLQGVLSVDEVIELGRKLCDALSYAHHKGVIHRDIKPANILFNEQREPKIADFGLARRPDLVEEGLTLAGAQLLTLGYGAPEQEVDATRVDRRADLYSLAATLWFALTGRNPRHFRESEVPPALQPVLCRALKQDREQRFPDANAMREALEQARGRPEPAPESRLVPGLYWVCPRCSRPNHERSDYCINCGAYGLTECPSCGKLTRIGAPFCGNCGVHIEHYKQNQERLELAKQAEAALHLSAALALLEQVGADPEAPSHQREQARMVAKRVEQAVQERARHYADLKVAIVAGQWVEVKKHRMPLLTQVPAEGPTFSWPVSQEDLALRQGIPELIECLRKVLRRDVEVARADRRLKTWAEASTEARDAFPAEPWVQSELCDGARLDVQFAKDLEAIRSRLHEPRLLALVEYRRLAELLDIQRGWNEHPQRAQVDQAVHDLQEKYRRTKRRRWAVAIVLVLGGLLLSAMFAPPSPSPPMRLSVQPPGREQGLFAANLGITYVRVPYDNGTFGARLIRDPLPGSPAAQLGSPIASRLEPGDTIFSIDGMRFRTPEDVLAHRKWTLIQFINVRTNRVQWARVYIP